MPYDPLLLVFGWLDPIAEKYGGIRWPLPLPEAPWTMLVSDGE